jgi:hypothetical protein
MIPPAEAYTGSKLRKKPILAAFGTDHFRGVRKRRSSAGQPANLSVAATRARLFGGSKPLWPLSGVMTRSASGQTR